MIGIFVVHSYQNVIFMHDFIGLHPTAAHPPAEPGYAYLLCL